MNVNKKRTAGQRSNRSHTRPDWGALWRGAMAVPVLISMTAVIAGCAAPGTGRAAHGSGRTGAQATERVVTLGRNGQAWQLASDTVSVRSQATWEPVNSPVTPAAGNSVVKDGSLILVAGITGTKLTLATSDDDGATWAINSAQLQSTTTSAFIALSPDMQHWLVGTQNFANTGSVSQYTQVFANSSSGALTPLEIPGSVANLAWVGSDLVVPGGPADSHLYVSTNLGTTWQDASEAVLGFVPPATNIPPTEPEFGPVIQLADGTAVVPVGQVTSTGLSVDLEATTTATSYTSIGTITATGSYGPGTLALASSSYGPNAAAFVLPGTTDLYVTGGASIATISMSGLPASPGSISFQDASNGIAQTTITACRNGKSDCTVTTSEYITSDGGRTWTLS
jgi:hypothetical protein